MFPRLHIFTGGQPLTLDALWARFKSWSRERSPDGREAWLNWIVRLQAGSTGIGTVQAEVAAHKARVAWVIGEAWQGNGYAKEAALGLVQWLLANGVIDVSATINAAHFASGAVARWAGLEPTEELLDTEVIWRLVSH